LSIDVSARVWQTESGADAAAAPPPSKREPEKGSPPFVYRSQEKRVTEGKEGEI
jgi:hypothetical protein